jgi:RNA polymerase sigma-70 factor (ECF subfamily)
MGIAYRAGLKALRRRGAEPVHGDNVAQDLIPSTDPEEVRELRDWITKGFAQLKPDHRLVLELVYGIGHSLDDVAIITGVPLGTVRARLFHARVNLRNVLPVLGGKTPQATAP